MVEIRSVSFLLPTHAHVSCSSIAVSAKVKTFRSVSNGCVKAGEAAGDEPRPFFPTVSEKLPNRGLVLAEATETRFGEVKLSIFQGQHILSLEFSALLCRVMHRAPSTKCSAGMD